MRTIGRMQGSLRRVPLALACAVLVLLVAAAPALAAGTGSHDVKVSDLVTERISLNGQSVRLEAEVVGSRIDADRGHAWVLVSDGNETVSVYMKDADADQIEHYGEYGTVGDTVRVTGVYHVECMTHDGDIDVHASEVSIVEPGGPVEEPASPEPLVPAIVVLALGAVAAVVYWRLRERLR